MIKSFDNQTGQISIVTQLERLRGQLRKMFSAQRFHSYTSEAHTYDILFEESIEKIKVQEQVGSLVRNRHTLSQYA